MMGQRFDDDEDIRLCGQTLVLLNGMVDTCEMPAGHAGIHHSTAYVQRLKDDAFMNEERQLERLIRRTVQ